MHWAYLLCIGNSAGSKRRWRKKDTIYIFLEFKMQ